MYCTTCGYAVQNAANFCANCGTNTGPGRSASRRVRSGPSSPVFSLRPKFVPWLSVLSILPLQIFMTIWGAFFFGGFATVALGFVGTSLPKWAPFFVAGSFFFIAIPIAAYVLKQKSYAKTEYQFHPHKLDYYEGFLTVEEKSIDYDNITEVNLRKGIFQKMWGLGTIILTTPATSNGGGRARSGILIADVPNPDRVYQQVKELIRRT